MANTSKPAKASNALAFMKTKGFALITDAKKLDAEMRELSHTIKVQDARINLYLLSEIAHIEQHRNPTRLNTFFTSIAKSGARVDAMHKMIQLFANVKFIDPSKRRDPMRNVDGDLVCEFFYEVEPVRDEAVFQKKMEEAITKPWTEWKAPPKVQDFTLAGQIKRLIETATKRVAEPVEGAKTDVNMDLLNGLEALAVKYGIEFEDHLKNKNVPAPVADDTPKASAKSKAKDKGLVEG